MDQLAYGAPLREAIKTSIDVLQGDRRAEQFVYWQLACLIEVEQARDITARYS